MINKYKGYTWYSYADLSRQLGKCRAYVYNWLKNHKNKTVYNCIEYVIYKTKGGYNE